MIKDKLHTISDDEAKEVGEILFKSSTSYLYNLSFVEIKRYEYKERDGVDAEECVSVQFNAVLKDKNYEKSGWQDKKIIINLIERDRYHDYPHFSGMSKDVTSQAVSWGHYYLSNHIEAIEYLQKKNLI
jgi:hypothetical protein